MSDVDQKLLLGALVLAVIAFLVIFYIIPFDKQDITGTDPTSPRQKDNLKNILYVSDAASSENSDFSSLGTQIGGADREFLLKEAARRFISKNSCAEDLEISDVSLSLWQPVKISVNCSAEVDLSYRLGKVDKIAYARAVDLYNTQYQSYQAAYNQYVHAMNQIEATRTRERNLEWHKQSSMRYPDKPTKPIAPSESDFVIWNDYRTNDNFSTSISESFLLGGVVRSSRYFNYLSPHQRTRQSYLNIFHEVASADAENYKTILSSETHAEVYSAEQIKSIETDVNRKLSSRVESDAKLYTDKWYCRESRVEHISYKDRQVRMYSADLYIADYSYKGKVYPLIIDCTNNLINGSLPSNLWRVGIFAICNLALIWACLSLGLLLANGRFDKYIGSYILFIITGWLAFQVLLRPSSLIYKGINELTLQYAENAAASKALLMFSRLLRSLSFKHSGFVSRTISMNLSDYIDHKTTGTA